MLPQSSENSEFSSFCCRESLRAQHVLFSFNLNSVILFISFKKKQLGDGAVNCADCGLCRLSSVFSVENSSESSFSSYQMQELVAFSREQSTFGSARC